MLLGGSSVLGSFPHDSVVKKLPANAEDTAQWDIIPVWENPLEQEITTECTILA